MWLSTLHNCLMHCGPLNVIIEVKKSASASYPRVIWLFLYAHILSFFYVQKGFFDQG